MLIFVAVAAGLVSLYWLAMTLRPLGEKKVFSAEDWARLEDDSVALLERLDRLIEELQDLEFEASLDKIGDEDLAALRQRYEREALNLMGKLEDDVGDFGGRIEADIESLFDRVRARRDANSAEHSSESVTND